ncbi:MAG: fibrobacter succinogenes major paralogous domain-containing protein, partial [Bacteroidales bacterium]
SGAYCCYGNDPSNCVTYGALYNWYAVETGKLCPSGWHVPTDDDFKTLEMYLGMTQAQADATGFRGTDQGSKLAGNASLWTDGALDQNVNFGTSGFSALPGGYRYYSDGSFDGLGGCGYWWSSTEYDGSKAWNRNLGFIYAIVYRDNGSKRYGFSVRCLRD